MAKFSLEELDGLKGIKARADYANKFLKMLGHGSARMVFDMGDSVLKLARSEAGVA